MRGQRRENMLYILTSPNGLKLYARTLSKVRELIKATEDKKIRVVQIKDGTDKKVIRQGAR
jgi:hypothetical protein